MTDVLLVIRSLEIGGAERQLTLLARGLAADGMKVTVAVLYLGGEFEKDLRDAGIPIVHLEKRARWNFLAPAWRFFRLVRRERPRVVYSFMPVANVLTSVIRVIAPRSRLIWGIRASGMDFRHYSRFASLVAGLERLLMRAPHLAISNSYRGSEDAVAHGMDAARIVVIPNGIDVERFSFDGDGRVALRQKWGIPPDALVLGVVARLDPMKAHEDFVDAAAKLADHDARTYFVCIGSDVEGRRQSLARRAKDAGVEQRVRFLEPDSRMPAVYSALDVLVSTSRFGEGFSNSIAEAMACERPCIATDVGDSARIVNAEIGWIVPAGDVDSLRDAMRAAAEAGSEARARLGTSARRRIVENFSAQICRRRTASALGLTHG